MREIETQYATNFLCAITGSSESTVRESPALLQAVFRALSRQEEIDGPRDQWSNWDWQFSESNRNGELYRPWLDERIRSELSAASSTIGVWPDGRRLALCLTHDVDGTNWRNRSRAVKRWVRHALSGPIGAAESVERIAATVRHRTRKSSFDDAESITARELDAWLDLESRFGYRSTFLVFPFEVPHRHRLDCTYTLNDMIPFRGVTKRLTDIFREIAQNGWEIGLHGSYESTLGPNVLLHERIATEQALNLPLTSIRQHYLRWDASSTPQLQQSAGFLADSTQGFNRNVGFRAGTSFPYRCWDHRANAPSQVLEIPQHIMDGGLFESNSLEYDADLAIAHSVQLLDAVERVGGCLVLNFHTDHTSRDRYWATYSAVLEEASRRGAWGCTMDSLREWWITRERTPSAA